jgi:hypothetical protein
MALVRPLFLALVFAVLAFSLHATHVEAKNAEANTQCPPGGKIGQSCVDNTNGYKTKGKCAYVYVCKATDVNDGTPPICAGGSCPIGGPPPSNFNPYPKPVKVASGSPSIPQSGISTVEQGILDSVFGENDAVDPEIDLEEASAAANAQLTSLQEYSEAEDLLLYAPESFDEKTSTLFEDLRAQAVSLAPGQKPGGSTEVGGSVRLAYAGGGGFFGGDFSPPAGGGAAGTRINVKSFVDAPQLLARAVANAVDAIINILLADFSAAGRAWADASVDFKLSMLHFGAALKSIFAVLWEMLQSLILAYAQESGAENAQCVKGNYKYDYRSKTAPCTTEKCMLNAPCEGEYAKGFCAAESKCNAISVKICDANTGTCSWTKPQLTSIPPAPGPATTPELEPLPAGESGLSKFLEDAFKDAEAKTAQQLIDDASRRVDEALLKIQNDSTNFSEHFAELRKAQEDLALGQRLLTQDPSLKDYIRGVIAPRMTPTEELPDGNLAPVRTIEWFNQFGSTFDPFKVASTDLPPQLVQQAEEAKLQRFLDNWVLIGQKEINETYRNWLATEVMSPWTEVRVPSLEPEMPLTVTKYSFDSISDLVGAGVKCLFGSCPTPIYDSVPFGGINSVADFGLTEPYVVSGNLIDPGVSPFDVWRGETSLTPEDLEWMLAQESTRLTFSRPIEFPQLVPLTQPAPTPFPTPAPVVQPTPIPSPQPQPTPVPTPPRAPIVIPPTAPHPAPVPSASGNSFGTTLQSILPSLWGILTNLFKYLAGNQSQQPQTPQAIAPSASLTINPMTISKGERTRLSWSSTNTTACTVYAEDGSVLISNGPSGRATTSPMSVTSSFRLVCSGQGGSAESSARLIVR